MTWDNKAYNNMKTVFNAINMSASEFLIVARLLNMLSQMYRYASVN